MAGQDTPIPQRLSRRVLILDFDAITLITLERVLEDAGFDTTTTWNMRKAYLLLEQERFDLIVVGDHLPQIDAHAILHRIENLHRLIPCIVMRAQPEFSTHPKWSRLITVLSGCTSSQILEKVHQRISQSPSTRSSCEWTPAPATDDPPEPVLLKMMWG